MTVVAFLAAPFLVWAAARALATNSNQVLDWLPQNFEETRRLLWFAERFGSDELVAVGWDGSTLGDERIDQFVDRAREARTANNGIPMFKEVTSGRHLMRELVSAPIELPGEVARQRMANWLIGADGTTCIIARVNATGKRHENGKFRLKSLGEFDRVAAVQCLRDISEDIGIPGDALYMAGPTVDSVAIDLAGRQWTVPMGAASVLIGFTLAWICLRSTWQVLAVFTTSLLASAASLAVVYLGGHSMDAVLMTMPAIVFVLATSGGIHLTHYLNDCLKDWPADQPLCWAPWHAVQMGLVPSSLACLTTCIGLASLAISRVRPVIRFGVFSAIGVAICLGLLLLFWPSFTYVLLAWRERRAKARSGLDTSPEGAAGPHAGPHAISTEEAHTPCPAGSDKTHGAAASGRRWWWWLFRFSVRYQKSIVAVALVGLSVLAYGLTTINASVHLKNLLPQNSNLLRSYDWLQDRIGPMVPVEVVLEFPRPKEEDWKSIFKSAAITEALRVKIEAIEESGGTVAATTFVPDLPLGGGARNLTSRTLVGRRLRTNLDRFGEMGFICQDGSRQLWRISTRVSASELDFATFLDKVARTVESELAAVNAERNPDQAITSKICGAVPLIQMAQKQLLRDFIWSLALAFVLIGITIVILLRSVVAGVVAMIPNVFPTLVVFGWMGWKGTAIDIGTMMTASVALGVAVDDTLHFLVWVRRAMVNGAPKEQAICRAFEQSATAMLQTSLICGIGMAPFVVSPFGPIAGFAGMMFALLMMAIVGDLILLPALIASRIGRCFTPPALRAVEKTPTPSDAQTP